MSLKILVVSASETDRLFIKNTFNGYYVLIASNVLEAMYQIDIHKDIALIILDLDVQDTGGFQLLRFLNSNHQYKKLRTIILTNIDESENEIEGLRLGAVDYIHKPIHYESLNARIKLHFELIELQINKQKLFEHSLINDTIFQQVPIGIAISYGNEPFTVNSNVSINLMFEQITGRTKEELIKLGWAKITYPDDLEEDMRNYKRFQAGEITSYSMEKRYIKPDGLIVWVYMVVAPLTLSNDHRYNHICLIQDISKRKEIEKALSESERSKSVLLSHLTGMAYRCNYDREWTMQFVSDGCFKLTGYTPQSLLYNKDLSFNDLITPEYRDSLWKEWKRVLAKRFPFKYEYEITTAKGERKWVLEMGEGVYDENGKVEALEGIIFDISDRKKMENNLRYYSEHDIWTGLYNRRYLESHLKHDEKIRTTKKRAVLGINLSAVHLLSMTYGFHYSQELIKKVAEALKLLCTDSRQLFNTYENRFVFYVKAYEDKCELTAFCETVVNTLEAVVVAERIGVGIGIVEIGEHNKHDVDEILKNVLITSEKAISTFDRDIGFCFYDTEMEAKIKREETIRRELTQIDADENNDGLFLQFQPIFDLNSNQICGFEALARLNSDNLGLVPPIEFIPIAEKTKLIIPLGQRIIFQAFHFLNRLKKNGYATISVSINISAIQLLRKEFAKNLIEMINVMQVNPANICLEITESVFASNYQEINSILGDLIEFGLKIAIDDFGTEYSSLAREQELSVNCLKIDKCFTDKLVSLKDGEAIVGDIISMAHKLGHCVIAEGIEDERQREYLKHHGCDKIQGYLIGKPLDEEVALELLKAQSKHK